MASTISSIIFQTTKRVRMAGMGWMLYSGCGPGTVFSRQGRMNSESFFILQILFWGHSGGAMAGICFKVPKVIYFWANIMVTYIANKIQEATI